MTDERDDDARWSDICECVRRQEANNRDFGLNVCDFGCIGPDGVCDYNLGKQG